jgi:hypothetical protein
VLSKQTLVCLQGEPGHHVFIGDGMTENGAFFNSFLFFLYMGGDSEKGLKSVIPSPITERELL